MTTEVKVVKTVNKPVKKGVVALMVTRIKPTDQFIAESMEIIRDDEHSRGLATDRPVTNYFISMGDKWDDIQAMLVKGFDESSVGDLHLLIEGYIRADSLFYQELIQRYEALATEHNRPSTEYDH